MEATTLETDSPDMCNRCVGECPPKVNTVASNSVHAKLGVDSGGITITLKNSITQGKISSKSLNFFEMGWDGIIN
ncbi:hypothetical protein GQ457_12G018380 [Hibiscus cannabinus]